MVTDRREEEEGPGGLVVTDRREEEEGPGGLVVTDRPEEEAAGWTSGGPFARRPYHSTPATATLPPTCLYIPAYTFNVGNFTLLYIDHV